MNKVSFHSHTASLCVFYLTFRKACIKMMLKILNTKLETPVRRCSFLNAVSPENQAFFRVLQFGHLQSEVF